MTMETDRDVYAAFEAVEPLQAAAALSTLADGLHGRGKDGLDVVRTWDAFKRLLERRGYYVDTPERLAASLKEIEDIGEGFDLYDLARSLARYDAVRTQCRRLARARAFPDLNDFAAGCGCAHRRKEN